MALENKMMSEKAQPNQKRRERNDFWLLFAKIWRNKKQHYARERNLKSKYPGRRHRRTLKVNDHSVSSSQDMERVKAEKSLEKNGRLFAVAAKAIHAGACQRQKIYDRSDFWHQLFRRRFRQKINVANRAQNNKNRQHDLNDCSFVFVCHSSLLLSVYGPIIARTEENARWSGKTNV